MSRYATTVGNRRYSFPDLRDLMAKATPMRSGDALAGIAAANEKERAAAQRVLADVPLGRFLEELLIPYDEDEVTRLIVEEHDRASYAHVAGLTVGEFREWLLDYETDEKRLADVARGITPEMAAAVSKI